MRLHTEKSGNAEDISDAGERVSHLVQDTTFYGHLSIYDFASQFAQDAVVLDVGCGAGYGSAYLAEHGAHRVVGVDTSEKAIAFCKRHFADPRLDFRAGEASGIGEFPEDTFDLIYSSNVLEHVADVMGFLSAAWKTLKPSGFMLIAVPPIPNEYLEYLNVTNPYHLNIWSPRQWHHVLRLYFEDVTPYLHGLEEIGLGYLPEHISGERPITEHDFVFEACSVDAMFQISTITSIFVVRTPRPADSIPAADTPTPFVDHSYTRSAGEISPEVRRRLANYFESDADTRSLSTKTTDLLRAQGPAATFREALRYVRYRLGQ